MTIEMLASWVREIDHTMIEIAAIRTDSDHDYTIFLKGGDVLPIHVRERDEAKFEDLKSMWIEAQS